MNSLKLLSRFNFEWLAPYRMFERVFWGSGVAGGKGGFSLFCIRQLMKAAQLQLLQAGSDAGLAQADASVCVSC